MGLAPNQKNTPKTFQIFRKANGRFSGRFIAILGENGMRGPFGIQFLYFCWWAPASHNVPHLVCGTCEGLRSRPTAGRPCRWRGVVVVRLDAVHVVSPGPRFFWLGGPWTYTEVSPQQLFNDSLLEAAHVFFLQTAAQRITADTRS